MLLLLLMMMMMTTTTTTTMMMMMMLMMMMVMMMMMMMMMTMPMMMMTMTTMMMIIHTRGKTFSQMSQECLEGRFRSTSGLFSDVASVFIRSALSRKSAYSFGIACAKSPTTPKIGLMAPEVSYKDVGVHN